MKNLLAILLIATLTGCFSGTSGIDYIRTTTLTNGVVVVEEIAVMQPSDPLEGAYLETSGIALYAATGGAQDVSKKQKVIEEGKSKRAAYMWCGIVIIMGGLLLMLGALPMINLTNGKSNKIGLIMIGSGVAGIALIKYVDASASFMGWILPLAIVGSVGYIIWNHYKNKTIANAIKER